MAGVKSMMVERGEAPILLYIAGVNNTGRGVISNSGITHMARDSDTCGKQRSAHNAPLWR